MKSIIVHIDVSSKHTCFDIAMTGYYYIADLLQRTVVQ